jgi:hypothetical protein
MKNLCKKSEIFLRKQLQLFVAARGGVIRNKNNFAMSFILLRHKIELIMAQIYNVFFNCANILLLFFIFFL